jgi:hypothetical protein
MLSYLFYDPSLATIFQPTGDDDVFESRLFLTGVRVWGNESTETGRGIT